MRASRLQDLLHRSSMVFRGTIVELGASTLPAFPASENTMAVRVDDVVQAPEAFCPRVGAMVTVEPAASSWSPDSGTAHVFFANPLVFGETLVLTEVAHADEDTDKLREQIAKADEELDRSALRQRLEQAELVVTGVVVQTGRADVGRPTGRESEHDPGWWDAQIEVDRVIKGRRVRKLTVRYPTSRDVHWFSAPRFEAEQRGVWLLHRAELATLDEKTWTALQPMDHQPLDVETTIEELLG